MKNSKYPYIVAEISSNHNGSLARCLSIIDAAKKSGADAVKLQTYTPDTMVADRRYTIKDGPWKGHNLWELYRGAQTPIDWHDTIFDYCRNIGITCFSTPFDELAVDFLETLDCPIYKVASFELTDLSLIRKIAKTCKPAIFSIGMASIEEINAAVETFTEISSGSLCLLKCTSAYPAEISDANLKTITDLRSHFVYRTIWVGISDHTLGSTVPVTAAILGADMIEKHLTLDDEESPDFVFSMRPEEFASMVKDVRNAVDAMGQVRYGPSDSEKPSVSLRRSCYVVRDIPEGAELTVNNLKLRRPAEGIEAHHIDKLYGRRVKQKLRAGTPLTWEAVE